METKIGTMIDDGRVDKVAAFEPKGHGFECLLHGSLLYIAPFLKAMYLVTPLIETKDKDKKRQELSKKNKSLAS